MALTPSFTAVSVSGYPSQIRLTDTSSGSDGAIANRRVYIATCTGSFLVPTGTTTEYSVWNLIDRGGTTINLDVLSKDYAVLITVQWVDINGVVLYDTSANFGFTLYNETCDYGLTTVMSSNPLLINDNNFFKNKSQLREAIDSGNQALVIAADLYNAQQAYDRGTAIRLASQYFFNENG